MEGNALEITSHAVTSGRQPHPSHTGEEGSGEDVLIQWEQGIHALGATLASFPGHLGPGNEASVSSHKASSLVQLYLQLLIGV